MFLDLLLFALLGVCAGTFTGLVPGIHVNTIVALLFGVSSLLAGIPPYLLIAFLVSMAVTHSFVNFIPGVFLGAPEESTALSVLPGHKLLLQGKGLEAVSLTVVGGIGVILLFVSLTPILLHALPVFYATIKYYIAWILLAILVAMLIGEKGWQKVWGLAIFLLAGFLGFSLFQSTLLHSTWVFFPLFTGLFGVPTLFLSLHTKPKIPEQEENFGRIEKSLAVGGIVKGFFSGLLVGILPGVGSAQAGTLAQQLTRKRDDREFLISVGGINTAYAVFTLLALYTIGRPRSGVAVAVERVLGQFGFHDLFLLLSASLLAAGLAAFLTFQLSKFFIKLVKKVSYAKLSLLTLTFLILLTFFFTGFVGLLVLFVSSCVGLLAPLTQVKRSFCMGCILLPVILWYSGV